MIAAIYSRKSVFTGKGESIENQISLCKNYAKNMNIDKFLIYEDEGYSGGNTNRPEFQKLLNDAKKKIFDVLICYRLDRISRNVADFSSTLELLQDHDISFISIKEQFDTSTPMGKAMVYIASVFAQLERETIAERIRDNMLELSKTGRWLGGQCPLGFISEKVIYRDNELKEHSMYTLSPIPEELKIIELIYTKYLETGSIASTLKYLLSCNIRGKNGGDFSGKSLETILRNPVYVKSDENVFKYLNSKEITTCGTPNGNGLLIYNKKNSKYKVKDTSLWIAAVSKHKGIIYSDSWLKVQKNLDKNSKKSNPRQGTSKVCLLSGILKCGKCGAPMRISYGRFRKDGTCNYYYTCTMKARSGKTRCNNKNVNGPYIEKVIIENIKSLNKDKILQELEKNKTSILLSNNSSIIKSIEKDIDSKAVEMDSLLKQLSKSKSDITSEFIMKKIDSLGLEIKELQYNKEKFKNESSSNKDLLKNTKLIIDALNEFDNFFIEIGTKENDETIVKRKRYLLEMMIDKIYWNSDTEEIKIDLWGCKKK